VSEPPLVRVPFNVSSPNAGLDSKLKSCRVTDVYNVMDFSSNAEGICAESFNVGKKGPEEGAGVLLLFRAFVMYDCNRRL